MPTCISFLCSKTAGSRTFSGAAGPTKWSYGVTIYYLVNGKRVCPHLAQFQEPGLVGGGNLVIVIRSDWQRARQQIGEQLRRR
jgi:hypothetical protein